MNKLFSMAPLLKENNIHVILIQIDEAHSDDWPVGIESILRVEQPRSHTCFEDRMKRAHQFMGEYEPPFDVLVDGFNNDFAETFQAWPDKFYLVDSNLKICAKSEYHREGDLDAKIIEDCTDLLQTLIKDNL